MQTKPRVALQMLQRALDAQVPFTWFTADEAFGQVKYIRVWLEERDVFHVLATRCNDDVSAHGIGYGRVDAIIDTLPANAWKRMSCGDGAHGPRVYDWARVPIRPHWAPGRGHWLLAPAQHQRPDRDRVLHLLRAPAQQPGHPDLGRRPALAGRGMLQTSQAETGLDDYQVRTWRGWYAHITLSMLALAWLAAVRAAEHQKGVPPPTTMSSYR